MELGIVTYNLAGTWDLATLLAVLAETGIRGLELRTTHAHGVEPSLDREGRARVRDAIAAAGIAQLSLGTVCEFHSPDPAEVARNVEACRAFVELARDIGARAVKVRPNDLSPGEDPDAVIGRIGRALAACGRIGDDHGVDIWMEVHGRGTEYAANARRILEAGSHPRVGATWNSNRADVRDGSIREAFGLLGPFIRCCHVTELWNDYPWRELFALLDGTGFSGFALAEIPQPIEARDGVPFLRCYRALWNELRRAR